MPFYSVPQPFYSGPQALTETFIAIVVTFIAIVVYAIGWRVMYLITYNQWYRMPQRKRRICAFLDGSIWPLHFVINGFLLCFVSVCLVIDFVVHKLVRRDTNEKENIEH